MRLSAATLWFGLTYALCVQAQVDVCKPEPLDPTDKYLSPHSLYIRNQSHADMINRNCDTIHGNLELSPDFDNRTAINISLDAVKYLNGNIWFPSLSFSRKYQPAITSFSMKSLLSVNGSIEVQGITSLASFSLPSLQTAEYEVLFVSLPGLSGLDLSSLASVGYFKLNNLPKLQSLHFRSGFREITGRGSPTYYEKVGYAEFGIRNTSLSEIDGLVFPTGPILVITENPKLKNFSLDVESFKFNTKDGTAVYITENPGLILSFPYLKDAGSSVTIKDVGLLDIPSLATVNGSLSIATNTIKSLNFSSLVSVAGRITVNADKLSRLDLPVLRNADTISLVVDPAGQYENGITIANLSSTRVMDIGDSWIRNVNQYCQIFNNMRCRGLITDYLQCGSDSSVQKASDPNECDKTYPAYGWTLAKKLSVGIAPAASVLISAALLYSIIRYRRKTRPARMERRVAREEELRRRGRNSRPRLRGDDIELREDDEDLPKYQQHEDSDGEVVLPTYNETTLRTGSGGASATVARDGEDAAENAVQEMEAIRVRQEELTGAQDRAPV